MDTSRPLMLRILFHIAFWASILILIYFMRGH